MTKKDLPATNAFEAAIEYISRRLRFSHPDGWFDKHQRWYPDDCEDPNQTIRDNIRTPSGKWPYSYLIAARSLNHVCELKQVDAKSTRKAMKELQKRFKCETRDDLNQARKWLEKGGLLFEAIQTEHAKAPSRAKSKL